MNDYYFIDVSSNKVYHIRAHNEYAAWHKYIDRFKLTFGRTYEETREDLEHDIFVVNNLEEIP